jgi:hypothetical protein
MSSRHEAETRTIHPLALAELGEEACIIALGVARDLRSGVIPPEKYDQKYFNYSQTECGTACCIAGWMLIRGVEHWSLQQLTGNLFAMGVNDPTPARAADAIERYVYDGSQTPWTPA